MRPVKYAYISQTPCQQAQRKPIKPGEQGNEEIREGRLKKTFEIKFKKNRQPDSSKMLLI